MPLPLVNGKAPACPYQQTVRYDDRRQQHTSATAGLSQDNKTGKKKKEY